MNHHSASTRTARDGANDVTDAAPKPAAAGGDYADTNAEPRLSPTTLETLLNSAPVAIVAVNSLGDVVFANQKLEELFGYTHAELMGMPVELLMPERFHDDHVSHRNRYSVRPHSRTMGTGMDLSARRKDGVEFPIEAGLSHVRVDGELLTLSSVVDVSRRKATEDMLERGVEERTRELERRRRVSDSLRDVLDILNSDRPLQEILDYITMQASHLLGAEASAIYQLQDDDQPLEILASHGLSDEEMVRAADMAGGSVVETGYDPVGSYRAQLAVPLATRNDIFGGLMLYYRDTRHFSSEEIELAVTFGEQAKLAIENARLRAQSAQLAVAAERNRIARDLHDSVTQTLFSASLIAEVLPRLWEKDHDESVRRLAELRLLTRGALAEMRTLLLELRPATLIEVDINELLRQLTEAAIGRARIPVALTVEGSAQVPPDVKIACYHVAQEALNNVTKHARAENATISLVRQPGHVVLTVQDDGRGFEQTTVTPEHLGLTIMHERAADIGAALTIRSAVGAGTTISISWNAHE